MKTSEETKKYCRNVILSHHFNFKIDMLSLSMLFLFLYSIVDAQQRPLMWEIPSKTQQFLFKREEEQQQQEEIEK